MNPKETKLRRLLAVRESRERLEKLELQRHLASARAMEKAIAEQESFRLHARHAGDAALRKGDQEEWLMSQAEYEIAGWNKSGLDEMSVGVNDGLVRAEEYYANCHLEYERSKILLEEIVQEDRMSEDRRSQLEIDSWFLSRLLGRKLRRA